MGRNILVVEDDRNISDLIHMYLVKEGFDVRIAGDGGKAIEEFQRAAPDLILLDIRMTPKNGFETLREIRDMKDRADIPVIMLTAMEDKDSVLEGITLGISDYILKPFAPDDLLSRIRRVLDGEGQKQEAQFGQNGGGAGV